MSLIIERMPTVSDMDEQWSNGVMCNFPKCTVTSARACVFVFVLVMQQLLLLLPCTTTRQKQKDTKGGVVSSLPCL